MLRFEDTFNILANGGTTAEAISTSLTANLVKTAIVTESLVLRSDLYKSEIMKHIMYFF